MIAWLANVSAFCYASITIFLRKFICPHEYLITGDTGEVQFYPEFLIVYVFYGGCILGALYVIYITVCGSGPPRRLERTEGRPRVEDEYSVMQGSYGFDVSYTPGNRASSAGPLPVGGRQSRPPTRSFSSYTNPRRKEAKED